MNVAKVVTITLDEKECEHLGWLLRIAEERLNDAARREATVEGSTAREFKSSREFAETLMGKL